MPATVPITKTPTAILSRAMDRIADTMQVPLTYDEGAPARMTGWRTGNLHPLPLLKLFVAVSVKGYFDSTHLGVLFHVDGHLYVLVTYYYDNNVTSVFLIDRAKLKQVEPADLLTPGMTGQQAVDAMRDGIVQSFLWKDRKWQTMQLPAKAVAS